MLHAGKLIVLAMVLLGAPAVHGQTAAKLDLARLMAIYDLDRNGVLSREELALLNRDIRIARERAARKHGETAAPQPNPSQIKPRDNNLTGVLLLRDQYALVPFITADGATLSKNGASFSWTTDRRTNVTTIQGNGALFYALHGDTNLNTPGTVDAHTPRLTHLALIMGLEWDVMSRNSKREGSVSVRGGAEFEISGGLFPTQYLRGTAFYTTDIANTNAELFGTEWSYIPVAPRLRIGARTMLNESLDLWLRFHPTLNVDAMHVGRNGTFGNLTPNRDYLWLGPKVHAEVFFDSGPFDGFTVFAKYFYLYDVLNGANSSVNFLETGIVYPLVSWNSELDPASRAKLSATFKYTVGKAPRTLQHKDELFAGLEVKLGDIVR